jgi:hypothetical protein
MKKYCCFAFAESKLRQQKATPQHTAKNNFKIFIAVQK